MDVAKEMNEIIKDTTIWTPKILKPQTIILHQDSELSHSYYLKEGILKVYNDEKGESATINVLQDKTLLPFDHFPNKTSFVNIITLNKTLLYAISDVNYRLLRKNNPTFNQIAEQSLNNMMDSFVCRTLVLLEKNVIDRYRAAIKYFPCVLNMSDVEVGYFIRSTPKRLEEIKKDVIDEYNKNKRNKGKNGNISASK